MLGDTGFEAHRGAGGNVEPVAVGRGAVELQRGVGLRQVHVTADLNRAVAGVDDVERAPLGAGVDRDIAVSVEDFARRPGCAIRLRLLAHAIGWCTVTNLVPSGKVASTWTS